ncbi:MAG: helical backbone metal receptor [Sulfurimonas sp.]|nr:helical backbone metal receptor [Sulfurimonas sp.]
MRIKTALLSLIFILNLQAKERIISLSPSITEIIFALDKGDEIVGTSSYSLFPSDAKKIPIIGGYQNPHLEKILGLFPTLIIGQNHNKVFLEKFKHFNIKTLDLDLQRIDTIKESIEILNKTLVSTQGEHLTNKIDKALLDAKTSTKPHNVLIVYGLREDLRNATYIAGHDIFFEDIIHECGHTNAYTQDSMSQPVLSYENIIAINPDQIIILHSLASEKDADVKQALANWYSLPTNASKNKRISIIDEGYLHIPSHRIALTIKRLCGEMND